MLKYNYVADIDSDYCQLKNIYQAPPCLRGQCCAVAKGPLALVKLDTALHILERAHLHVPKQRDHLIQIVYDI